MFGETQEPNGSFPKPVEACRNCHAHQALLAGALQMLLLVPSPHKLAVKLKLGLSMVGQQCKNNLEPLNVPKMVGDYIKFGIRSVSNEFKPGSQLKTFQVCFPPCGLWNYSFTKSSKVKVQVLVWCSN